ncbi:MAG: hypothetical protein D6732_21590 [Methanobacteriota archaeon]|nr:MAG: hypothetical protein D6732_21590 [Euryarchaeota archaeon]
MRSIFLILLLTSGFMFVENGNPQVLTKQYSPHSVNAVPILESRDQIIPIGEKVLFQPFYWNMPDRGTHWRMLGDNIDEITSQGFDSLWLPPPQKTREGYPATGGYEPYDYYDLGSYDQKGRIRTLFGTQEELTNLISLANANGIGVIADVVINHRVGGDLEYNPFTQSETPTNFMNVASGRLRMNYTHFWPNQYGNGDAGQYGDFPDISHANPEVRQMFLELAQWLTTEIGYDGFRFDSAQFIDPTMIRDWMQAIGGGAFGVSEYWMYTPDPDEVLGYLREANDTTRAMDFALLEAMRLILNANGTGDLRNLVTQGISNIEPSKAVTFVVNHDTYRDKFDVIEERRHLGYGYIMTHPGYPSVFYMDYIDPNLRNTILQLVKIHNRHAKGNLTHLYVDQDLYISQRDGNGTVEGLLFGMNDRMEGERSAMVTTRWKETKLYNLLNGTDVVWTDAQGNTTVTVPANEFVIYSPDPSLIRKIDLRIPKKEFDYGEALMYKDIAIDGELDWEWGLPNAIDHIETNQITDLTNLYFGHDGKNLLTAFAYINLYNWTEGPVDFEIILDTREGGSNLHPIRENVRFGGRSRLPDEIFVFKTDFASNGYHRIIKEITRYSFQNGWKKSVVPTIQFETHPMMGLVEVAIPFADLGSDERNKISVKVVSALSGSQNVQDSVPTDTTIDENSLSWLFMEDLVELPPQETTSDLSSTPSPFSTTMRQTLTITYWIPIFGLIVRYTLKRKR